MYLPTTPSPPTHGDDLSAVVVRRLATRGADNASWGLFQTLLLGIPSFGLLPLLVWPARFREYVADEHEAIRGLADWSKLRGRNPAAVGPLMAAVADTSFRPLPWIISLLGVIFIASLFVVAFRTIPFSWQTLLECTYLHWQGTRLASPTPASSIHFLYKAWAIGLSIGYGFHWLQVRSHAQDVRQFVARFNPVAEAEMLPAVKMPTRGWAYFRPLWIATAVVLGCYGAWWGIPMVLAGMAQRRYTKVTGPVVRAELAKRVQDVASMRQMPMSVLMPVTGPSAAPPTVRSRRCANPRCLATVWPEARFCTRCGTRTG